jgi:putative oxidoreductase
MKTTSIVARYLLGLMFTVFGLNGFLNFIHQPPPTNPLALQFFGAIVASHFAAFFFAGQVFGGLLLLFGRFVPLALTLLAAELYNILAFHLTMSPGTIAPALVACVLWILVFLQYRESFKGIFSAKGCDAGINCVAVYEARGLRAKCMIGDTALEWRKRRSASVLSERELISEGEDMSQQRGISRVVNVPPAAPGFVGPGHLAAPVVSPENFEMNDPFIC